jgi:hypothetical protein
MIRPSIHLLVHQTTHPTINLSVINESIHPFIHLVPNLMCGKTVEKRGKKRRRKGMTLMGQMSCFSQHIVMNVVIVTVGTCVITIHSYLRLQYRHASGDNRVGFYFARSGDSKLRRSL